MRRKNKEWLSGFTSLRRMRKKERVIQSSMDENEKRELERRGRHERRERERENPKFKTGILEKRKE